MVDGWRLADKTGLPPKVQASGRLKEGVYANKSSSRKDRMASGFFFIIKSARGYLLEALSGPLVLLVNSLTDQGLIS